jgi:hypothetical protein
VYKRCHLCELDATAALLHTTAHCIPLQLLYNVLLRYTNTACIQTVPPLLALLIEQSWDPDATNRPTLKEILEYVDTQVRNEIPSEGLAEQPASTHIRGTVTGGGAATAQQQQQQRAATEGPAAMATQPLLLQQQQGAGYAAHTESDVSANVSDINSSGGCNLSLNAAEQLELAGRILARHGAAGGGGARTGSATAISSSTAAAVAAAAAAMQYMRREAELHEWFVL